MTSGVPGRGCVWKSEERAGVVVRREVSHGGGQAGCRMPGPEMGHGVRAGPERPARSAELSWEGSRGGGTASSWFSDGVVAAGVGRTWRRPFYLRRQVLWAERTFIFAAGAAGRRALSNCLASLHVCFVPLRLFDPCGGRVAATAHVRHKSGKSGFPAVAESAFPAFVYLRYFCRDTAPATGSNSS